ncbi:serine hydrolase [Myroides sp. WP-1]|uniref:serine hydrolase domain-containing protein n=1 Tax=Myroides sp. WP-1 TaxID=2759944 RepID=UPI0015F87830|nr:serine hydrolase domain-containing protein [Myroides sp. WP-1]MBB1140749.1 beta-lactamase family protein [Myroides sp. WP-1]
MKTISSLLILFLPIAGVAQIQTVFQQKIDSIYNQNRDAVGIIVHVEAPEQQLSWSYAHGLNDKNSSTPLLAEQPVLLASNTKPYVAASILRLVELGKVSINQAIDTLLTEQTRQLFSQKGYDLKAITIKHLLSHTAGIQDYVDDAYFTFVNENPTYQWSKQEQIDRAIQLGNPKEIGKEFSYGDINYLLLTEILENQTKQPFYEAMRSLLKYEELGLNETWFIQLEDYPTGTLPLAHQYAKQYKHNSSEINPSWDLYGGGGIAATAKDAALFFHYLFEGKIIEDPTILASMSSYVLAPEQSKYCLGIFHFDFGFHAFYHGGWWGTDVLYSPEAKASVAVFTLQKEFQHSINPYIGKTFLTLLLNAKK